MRKVFILLTLLLCSIGFSMDPPAISWVKNFFQSSHAEFHDVHETSDGGFIVAGWHLLEVGGSGNRSIYRFDDSGDSLWSSGASGFEYQGAHWVEELMDQSLIVAGGCGLAGASSSEVMLFKADSDGSEIWTKTYDLTESNDIGNSLVVLEDGYAITGSSGDNAFVIRTDLQGDSLWSATYEGTYSANARRILKVADTLIVFISGMNIRILAFSIEDGQLLWEADDFPSSFGSSYVDRGDMTLSTTDNGFTFVNAYFPNISHTDSLGNLLWYYQVPYANQPYSTTINNTMDGGYIYGGLNTEAMLDTSNSAWSGMVVKFDSEGQEHWRDYVYECYDLFSIRQLSEGGYIACGHGANQGTLIRYAPETGIEEESNFNVTCLYTPSPNPFSSTLNIGFNLSTPSSIELSVFDLSGRQIEVLEQGYFAQGNHSLVWIPEGISSGCYFLRLSTPEGLYTQECLLIR